MPNRNKFNTQHDLLYIFYCLYAYTNGLYKINVFSSIKNCDFGIWRNIFSSIKKDNFAAQLFLFFETNKLVWTQKKTVRQYDGVKVHLQWVIFNYEKGNHKIESSNSLSFFLFDLIFFFIAYWIIGTRKKIIIDLIGFIGMNK